MDDYRASTDYIQQRAAARRAHQERVREDELITREENFRLKLQENEHQFRREMIEKIIKAEDLSDETKSKLFGMIFN